MNLFLILTAITWMAANGCSLHYLRLANMARKARRQEPHTGEFPPVSIVLTVHNQARELQANLPVILQQDYPAPFEVIVVDTNSDDGTLKMLEKLEEEYLHLHHTFCPDTARDISISRLALTLGFRSACYEWVLMLAPDACPSSSLWLRAIAQSLTQDADAVQGFVSISHPHGWSGIKQHFFRLWQQSLWMPWDTRFAPYRASEACLAYRKSLFMSHQGFASSFSLRYGAGALLVNHNVQPGRMKLALQPDALLTQEQPTTLQWKHQRLFFMETRRHMHHSLGYRLWYATLFWGNYIWLLLAAFTLLYFHPHIYIMYSIGILWLLSIITACATWHCMARRLGVRSYALLLPLLRAFIPWWDASAWLHWRFESRKTFRKKFV